MQNLDTEALLAAHYEKLRQQAHRMMARERRFFTLPATEYLHRAFLRARDRGTRFSRMSKPAFFRYLRREMRWVRLDHIRRRRTTRRGGDMPHLDIATIEGSLSKPGEIPNLETRIIEEALTVLSGRSKHGPRMVRALRLRMEGRSIEEIARELGVSRPTAAMDLNVGFRWLRQYLRSDT